MKRRFPEAPRPTFTEEDGLFEDENWRDNARCRDMDGEKADRLFFSDELVGDMARVAIQEAKAMCGQCPVAADCLYFAMTTQEKHGIWGGMTTEERRIFQRSDSRKSEAA